MVWIQEESVSERTNKLYSSPLWIRWIWLGWNPMRLVTLKNRAIQKYFETLSEYSTLVQLEAPSTKRTAILSNKIKRNYLLRHTACRVHWESDMREDQGSAFFKGRAWFWDCVLFLKLIRKVIHNIYLYKKEDHLGNRNKMRRATLKPEATLLTTEHLEHRSQRWNCRMHGNKQCHKADWDVRKNISIRNNSLKTWVKSRRSQQLLVDMNHTEIFAPCENSAKQCPDCNSFTEIGIICCSCERNLKYSQSPSTLQKTNCDFSSILGFVIQKNSSRRAKHGASERQVMFFRAKQILHKARQSKHGNHPTILSRWYDQEEYRKSLAEHKIREKEVMLFDRIALERHDYTATRAERLQNAKHWILRLNADAPQKPLRQRPECAVALKQCLKMQDAYLMETQQSLRPIRPKHQQRQREDQQFEGGENFDYYVVRKTGWRYYREPSISSVFTAVAHLIKELPEDQKAPGRPVAEEPTE